MLAVQLLKDTVKTIRRKMKQIGPGVYQPIDPEIHAGDMVDRLFNLSMNVRFEEVIKVEVFEEIETIISILGNAGFNFDSENCRLLWSVNQEIRKIEHGSLPPLSEDGGIENILLIKKRLRMSLIEAISIQTVSK